MSSKSSEDNLSIDEVMKLLVRFRDQSHRFVTSLQENSDAMKESANLKTYQTMKKVSFNKLITQSQQCVEFHNKHVSNLDVYMENFFKMKNLIKTLELEISFNEIKQRDLKLDDYYTQYVKLFNKITDKENEIFEKFNAFTNKINFINTNPSNKPTTKEIKTMLEQSSDIQVSFYNYVVFHRNIILEILKKTWKNKFDSIKPSDFVKSLANPVGKDQKED